MSRLTRAIRIVRHWHARIGVLMSIFLLLLSITGFALSHTDDLGLAKREIHQEWLMDWYGLKVELPTKGYLFEDGYLTWADRRWVMDGKALQNNGPAPVGAMAWNGMRAIADKETLYLYMPDGQLVEKISGTELPALPLINIGYYHGKIALQTAKGNFISDDAMSWSTLVKEIPVWSSVQELPKSLSQTLRTVFSPSLPLERIVLDLHSGRIFGRYGALFIDFIAFVLIVLSMSGLWIYFRTIRRQSHPGDANKAGYSPSTH